MPEHPLLLIARSAYRKFVGRDDAALSDIPMHLLRRFYGDERTITVDGHPFTVNMNDNSVSAHILFFRHLDELESRLMRQLVRPGDYAVDLGANIGWYTILLGRLVSPAGKVFAVEAERTNAALLRRNIADQGLASIVDVEEVAAGAIAGTATLHIAPTNKGDHRVSLSNNIGNIGDRIVTKIRVAPLDTLLAAWPRIDFLKMDIQGFEFEALRGMQETLRRSPSPVLLAEFWPYGIRASRNDPIAMLAYIRDAGFRIWKTVEAPPFLVELDRKQDAVFTASVGDEETLEVTPNIVCARSAERLQAFDAL